jgi:hypothetical protein
MVATMFNIPHKGQSRLQKLTTIDNENIPPTKATQAQNQHEQIRFIL